MRTLADDDDDVKAAGQSTARASQQPAWMRALSEKCREWLMVLPPVGIASHILYLY